MRRFRVLVTAAARRDLRSIHSYVASHDAPAQADALLDRLAAALETLAENPKRGTEPAELRGLGAHSIRQIVCEPYRIVYRIDEREVFIRLVADGRRDLQSVLAERLLRSSER